MAQIVSRDKDTVSFLFCSSRLFSRGESDAFYELFDTIMTFLGNRRKFKHSRNTINFVEYIVRFMKMIEKVQKKETKKDKKM